jgi:16S rRNA (cytidine1402-2'-O)-methyltransferase
VLIVSGALSSLSSADEGEGKRVLRLLLDEGLSIKQAAKLAHAITGAAKNAMYDLALQLRE